MNQKLARYNPERMAHTIGEHLASRTKPLTRSEIIEELGLESIDETTIWRWLNRAKDLGLAESVGKMNATRWMAGEEARTARAKVLINAPLSKRPVVTYDELWLRDYIPNETRYLSEKVREKLHSRSPIGSAPISSMDQHDMSTFLCGLPYGSSRLEGNGYTFLDTVSLIEQGLEKQGASRYDTQMILNHHQAVRFLIENTSYPPGPGDVALTGRDVRTIHSLLSENLLKDPGMSGVIRNTPITIRDCSYRPLEVRESIESCLNDVLAKASQIEDPFEQSFFLNVHIPYLQPFVDCNKRTARLLCNIPLLRAGLAPMSWMDVDRDAYRDALIAVYELNEPGMLSEVFEDGYMRSVEHFNIMLHSREPDEIVLKYGPEIRESVRNRILNNDDSIPNSVADVDAAAFINKVEIELDKVIALDPAKLFKNKLREGDIQAWQRSQLPSQHDRLSG